MVGERGFRDFSCLPPAEENRNSRRTSPAQKEWLGPRKECMSTNSVDGSDKNKEMERVLLDVIKSLEDGQKGFAEIGERLKDAQLKRYFLAESLKRASFRAELENELHRAGMADVKESGTFGGASRRAWADLKAKLGGGDHTLLETAEAGEDEAKKAYADALKHDLPLPVRQLLAEQEAHVLSAHDYVKSHRDQVVAK
jgi:uncharacterized protein (TIGR02284 family)